VWLVSGSGRFTTSEKFSGSRGCLSGLQNRIGGIPFSNKSLMTFRIV